MVINYQLNGAIISDQWHLYRKWKVCMCACVWRRERSSEPSVLVRYFYRYRYRCHCAKKKERIVYEYGGSCSGLANEQRARALPNIFFLKDRSVIFSLHFMDLCDVVQDCSWCRRSVLVILCFSLVTTLSPNSSLRPVFTPVSVPVSFNPTIFSIVCLLSFERFNRTIEIVNEFTRVRRWVILSLPSSSSSPSPPLTDDAMLFYCCWKCCWSLRRKLHGWFCCCSFSISVKYPFWEMMCDVDLIPTVPSRSTPPPPSPM